MKRKSKYRRSMDTIDSLFSSPHLPRMRERLVAILPHLVRVEKHMARVRDEPLVTVDCESWLSDLHYMQDRWRSLARVRRMVQYAQYLKADDKTR